MFRCKIPKRTNNKKKKYFNQFHELLNCYYIYKNIFMFLHTKNKLIIIKNK